MTQTKRILVLFENLNIRQETIQYSMALAQRIDARITMLMLLPNDYDADGRGDDLVAQGEQVLRKESEAIARSNIESEFQVRVGDPRSEFYKFMASHPSFHTAIWGGDENILTHGPNRTADHWITTIKNDLYCPLVTPKKR